MMKSFKVQAFFFPLFLMTRLPLAWVAGLRVRKCDDAVCVIAMRYGYWNRNPFGSLYFAAMAMAAEMSTGLPAFLYLRKHRLNVSLLLAEMQATYHKKATGLVSFEFDEVQAVQAQLGALQSKGDSCTTVAHSRCYDGQKQLLAEFRFIWTFRHR